MSKLETADTPPQSAAHQPESTQSFFRDAYALQSDRSSVGQTGGESKSHQQHLMLVTIPTKMPLSAYQTWS
jgi:hypothetical protein